MPPANPLKCHPTQAIKKAMMASRPQGKGRAIAFLFVLICLPAVAQFEYTQTTGTTSIVGYSGPGGTVAIPDQIDGLPVTSIAAGAFSNHVEINNVIIPNTVTDIGSSAFLNCIWLFDVTLPRNLQDIPDYTFSGCVQLAHVEIPGSVTNIGYRAFSSCASLTDVVIPDNVRKIGDWAFENCTRLRSASIGRGVLTVGYWSFYNCSNLATVQIGSSVTNLNSGAFEYCTRLRSIYFLGDMPAAIDPFSGDGYKAVVYYVPTARGWGATFDGLQTAPWDARLVVGNSSLEGNGFTIGLTATTNLAVTVESCINLTNPTWTRIATNTILNGDTVFLDTTFGNSAVRFYRLQPAPPVSYDYAISNGTIAVTQLLDSSPVLIIPETINGLPVTAIAPQAFWNRTDLLSVTIPDTVQTIGDIAFDGCVNLTNVVLGNSVRDIGGEAFNRCTSLSTVHIPASVTNIGAEAFASCSSLLAITVDPQNGFYADLSGVLVDFPRKLLIQYPLARQGDYTVPAGVNQIGDHSFANCVGLTDVSFPESLQNIGDSAFSYCQSLATVTDSTSVTNIGAFAFDGCATLTTIELGTNLISIGPDAFDSCRSLDGLLLPDTLQSIGPWAFEGCVQLHQLAIPDHVNSIAEETFLACETLTNVVVGAGVTNVADYAWAFCPALTSLYFKGNAPAVGSAPFFGYTTNVTVFYTPGTSGWGPTFGGRPTAVWNQ